MKHTVRIIAVLFLAAIVFTVAPRATALDENQEQELQKARQFLLEENFVEAMNVLKKLEREDSDDFRIRLAIIDTNVDHAWMLKANNDPSWKTKVYTAFNDLKGIFRAHQSSPEVYISFAKCYALNDRFQKAKKSLDKAFYFSPGSSEALVVQGDIYFDRAKQMAGDVFNEDAGKEVSQAKRLAVRSYEDALNSGGLNPETRAMISYKLGALYNHFRDKDKAKEYWTNAVQTASEGYWVKKSHDGLTLLD